MSKTSTLNLAEGLRLPLDTIVQRKAVIAKNRVGKSNLGCAYVEEVHEAGVQSIVLDPKGDWYGIRSSADGKGPGLPFLVMGGDHGDVPLDASAGQALGTYLGSNHVDVVLDVSDFSKRDLVRFGADFLEALYDARKKNRTPLNLVLEEAEDFAPQQIFEKDPNQYRCLGAVNKLAKKAGFLGIGLLLIAQRAASLNKNSLSQCDALFFMRTTAPQDIKAADAWLQDQDDEKRKEVLTHIQGLPTGAAYVWAPEHGIFQKAQIRRRSTFDAGFTPKVGESKPEPKVKAMVDLTKLMGEMADVVEKAKADDPAVLKATIRDLERKLKMNHTIVPEVRTMVKEVIVERVPPRIVSSLYKMADRLTEFGIDAKTIYEECEGINAKAPEQAKVVIRPRPNPVQPRSAVTMRPSGPPRGAGAVRGDDGDLPKGERIVLTAVAEYESGVGRETITVLTGYKRSSRDTYLQRLRERGYVETRGDTVQATREGIKALGPDFQPLPKGKALREHWLQRLPEGEKKVLEVLLDSHPEAIERIEIDNCTGYKRSSRDTYLQRLRSRQLVVTDGSTVRASDILFEG